MKAADLEKLEDTELDALRDAVAVEIRKRATKRQAAARRQIVELASKHDINLADLSTPSRPGEKTAPKYRDPSNQFNTWTGRGRKPGWLEALLKGGKKLEDLAITQ